MTIDISSPRWGDCDGFYAALTVAREGLSDDDTALFSDQLVLLLGNQVGDPQVLQACIDASLAALKTGPGSRA